jgi:hypothetical protein
MGIRRDWYEALVIVTSRPWRRGFRNVLRAAPARGGHSTMIGRKPIAFCAWLFDALSLTPGRDTLQDLFPGSGAVSAAWRAMGGTVK